MNDSLKTGAGQWFNRVIYGTLFVLFCLGFVGVSAASISGFFSDLCTPFELLCHFRVMYVLVFALFAITFVVLKRRWIAGLAVCMLVVNLVPIAALYVPEAKAVESKSRLKVLQFNLQGGKNKGYERTLAVIKETNPDVVGLSELTSGWAHVLETRLSNYPYRVVEPHLGGVSVFSKYPIADPQVKYFGKYTRPRILAKVNFKGRDIDVIFIHPVTPNKNRSQRNLELATVADEAKAFKNPGIVFGDMNCTPWSKTFDDLLKTGGLLDSERGFGFQPTWNAKMRVALFPIDHVLVTPDFSIHERKVLRSVGSDHYPVYVELGLNKS